MISLRPYQESAINAILRYWHNGGGNPLVDLATGTGKSLVIAELTKRLLRDFPTMQVLMLVHVRELVEQNAMELLKVWPDAPIGIYSAGLGRRDTHRKIIFGSIQSLFRQDGYSIGHRDLALIDEAHLVPTKNNGMYRTMLDNLRNSRPDLRVAGFTATPYRLDSGRLDEGNDRLFDEIVFSYGIGDGISDGFLSPLISKASATEVDVSNVARRGGEFVSGELETAARRVTLGAVQEMIRYGEGRRSWLAFCSGVKHAEEVAAALREHGVSAAMICGETPMGERDRIIRQFKQGQIRCLTNAQVLTTGFNAPGVDMVAMLRPTLSTSLYVQIVGRGTRLADGKENCLVLDFAGNIRRHGPVDAVSVLPKAGKGKGAGKVDVDSIRAKECPSCNNLAALNASICNHCGHVWPGNDKPKHEAEAEAEVGILSSERIPPQVVPVVDWKLSRHRKTDSPDSVKVTYYAGLSTFNEWVAIEHTGYASQKAQEWWSKHGGGFPTPKTVDEALDRADELATPATITVKAEGKFFRVVGRTFPPAPRQEAAE